MRSLAPHAGCPPGDPALAPHAGCPPGDPALGITAVASHGSKSAQAAIRELIRPGRNTTGILL
jgi:hypothetical protein